MLRRVVVAILAALLVSGRTAVSAGPPGPDGGGPPGPDGGGPPGPDGGPPGPDDDGPPIPLEGDQPPPESTELPGSSSEQDEALDAVTRGRALPLEVLLARIGTTIDGNIIDARLIRVKGILVYEIKMLSPDSQTVSRRYYNARSGQRLRTD
jgi:hypothetical protein